MDCSKSSKGPSIQTYISCIDGHGALLILAAIQLPDFYGSSLWQWFRPRRVVRNTIQQNISAGFTLDYTHFEEDEARGRWKQCLIKKIRATEICPIETNYIFHKIVSQTVATFFYKNVFLPQVLKRS